jgi:hypothetical protein
MRPLTITTTIKDRGADATRPGVASGSDGNESVDESGVRR